MKESIHYEPVRYALIQADNLLPLAGSALSDPSVFADGLDQRDQLENLTLLAETIGKTLVAYSKLWRSLLVTPEGEN